MKALTLINQMKLICQHHNINVEDVTIRFEGNDFDIIPEYDKETNTLTYHRMGYLTKKSRRYYEGDIKPDTNTIFVFGSNPEGRHGAGAAKIARLDFGAVYGVGEGLTGNAYALPTKDLRVTKNYGYRSIPPEAIIDSIKKLYEVAKTMPDKDFKVAYRNVETKSLNGYTGIEMIHMFKQAGDIPDNIIFSSEWINSGLF